MPTYNDLVAQIRSTLYSNSNITLEQIPNFIYEAQEIICRQCKNIGLLQYVTLTGSPQGKYVIQKPQGWRKTMSFKVSDAGVIYIMNLRSVDYIQLYCPDFTQQGRPLFYSDYGYNEWLIGPSPNMVYTYYISYIEFPPPLSANNQTNWLTDNVYDVLFNTALFCSSTFVKDDERVPVWEKKYKEGIASINAQDDQRVIDRQTNRLAD